MSLRKRRLAAIRSRIETLGGMIKSRDVNSPVTSYLREERDALQLAYTLVMMMRAKESAETAEKADEIGPDRGIIADEIGSGERGKRPPSLTTDPADGGRTANG